MKVLLNNKQLNKVLENNKNLNFVPTMGSLHEGHISLIKKSKTKSKNTIVSIFVNPDQKGIQAKTSSFLFSNNAFLQRIFGSCNL